MIHIRNKVKKLKEKWNKQGFNKVRVRVVIEGSDEPEPGEQTIEQKAEWDKNYAIFLIEPSWPLSTELYNHHPYIDPGCIRKDKFWDDIEEYLDDMFNSEDDIVDIRVNKTIGEIEIQRRGSRPN